MGTSIDKTGRRILAITAVVAVMLMLSLTMCNERRVVLSIDGFDLNKSKGITVGSNSDITFSRLSPRQLSATLADDGSSWDISVARDNDTLPYYKINTVNPNRHPLAEADKIEVVLAGGKTLAVEVSQLRAAGALAGHRSQYVMLSDALRCHDASLPAASVADVRSFFYRDESDRRNDRAEWQLVILDKGTRLMHEGSVIEYAYKFNTAATATPQLCKLQFWQMSRSTYCQERPDKYFAIDSVNIVAKPTLIATDWGAGHIMLHADPSGKTTRVTFPKPITYLERLDTLRAWASPYAGLLTLCQSGSAFPSPCAMLLPAFSSYVNSEICNLFTGGDSLCLRAPDGTTTALVAHHMAPTIARHNIHTVGGDVIMRAGVIDGGFALSYLYPLLLMLIALIIATWHTFDSQRLRKGLLTGYGYRQGPRQLVIIVLCIAATYCIAKCMIAFKLSYTYPYFDKLTAVTPVNAALTLLLSFALMVILNHSHVYIDPQRAVPGRKRLAGAWTAIVVTVVGLAACVVYLLTVLDPGVTPAVMDSYLPGEVFTFNVMAWNERVGINDLHRSVPYTLVLSIIVAIVAQAVLLARAAMATTVTKPSSGKIARLLPWWGWSLVMLVVITLTAALVPGNFATAGITLLVVVSLGYTARHIMTMPLPGKHVERVALGSVAGIAALLALLMIGCGLSFSRTAGVSLMVCVLGLAMGYIIMALARNCKRNNAVRQRVFRFVLMLAAAVAHFVAAVGFGGGDLGYFTNFVGFVIFVYLIYALSFKSAHLEQSGVDEREANEIEKRQTGWLFAGSVVLLALVLHVFVPNYLLDADKVDYGRGTRRMSLSSDFNQYSRSGYRYAVQDVEFMIVMDHYLNWNRGADPLSNERKPLHPSVSGGQSPVVLNDVSLQAAFLGAYGAVAYLAYGLLLVLLAWAVAHHSLPDDRSSRQSIQSGKVLTVSRTMAWRLLAMLMWVGTTIYLFLSYMGWLPFTGRLNPGMGVDAVGEALESAVLLAFMTATGHTHSSGK